MDRESVRGGADGDGCSQELARRIPCCQKENVNHRDGNLEIISE